MKQELAILLAAAGLFTLSSGTSSWAQSTSYFTGLYAFGDSLTDNGRIPREDNGYSPTGFIDSLRGTHLYEGGRWSNAPGYFEQLPGLIGVRYVAGNDYAIGGAQAIHEDPNALLSPTFAWGVPDQIDTFTGRTGRFGPRDLALLWIGYNDRTFIPAGTAQARAAGVSSILANNMTALNRLVGLGARQLLVFDQQTFRGNNQDLAASFNAELPGMLAQLSASGINVHYFDVDSLLNRLRANPTAFGYIAAAATGNCSADPACAPIGYLNGGAAENQYISVDGVHLTSKTNTFVAAFVANQLNAPLTMPVQADMAQSNGVVFANSLLDRLDAYRYQSPAGGSFASASNAYAMYAKAPPKQPLEQYGPWSIFEMGTYAHASQNSQFGVAGNDTDVGAGTVGVDYRWSRNLLLGGAFSYSDATANASLDNTRTQLRSYQFAGFASLNYANWFGDLVVSYGVNNYHIQRSGVFDVLSAAPNGNNFVAAGKAGYLFDTATVRVGPIVGLTYGRVWINAYTESGDPLLTQAVAKQNLDGWTASAGVQFRLPTLDSARRFNPFLNLTAEQDFGGNNRVITTAQTYALGLPIVTQVDGGHSQTYGKVAGGTTIDLGGRFSGMINAETTFARTGGNLLAITVGLSARL
jgi:outer membrane lipase/esterase